MPGLFGSSHGATLANKGIRYNPFFALEASFGDKSCPGRFSEEEIKSEYIVKRKMTIFNKIKIEKNVQKLKL